MKQLISFVLDETGSMLDCYDQTISGFNEYIDTLKKSNDELLMTLTKFNSDKVEVVYNAKPIKDVEKLTKENYKPDHLTPLYDSIGKTISAVEKEAKKDDKVLIVIMTDGEENASKEHNSKTIFDMIKKKQEENWTFVFLGANQDAWITGQKMGLHKGNVMSYTSAETHSTMTRAGGMSASFMASSMKSTKDFWKQ